MNPTFLPMPKKSMTSNIASPRLTALLAALIAIFFVGAMDQAQAQQTWNNVTSTKNWSNSASTWNSSDWWANPNGLLVFGSSGSGNVTNNMTDWLNFNGIRFDSGAASFTISGNSIGLTNNGNIPKIENSSVNTQTISLNNIALRNVSEFNPIDGDLVINSANVYLDSDLRVWGNNGKTLWLNGVLSQAGTLGIQQNSTVVFQQTMTYSGQTFIHAGQLVISNGARAGTGNINLGGTNIAGTSATNAFYLGLASSAGALTNTNQININAGGGASTIGANNTSGVNSFTGPIVLSANVSANVASGGTLSFNGIVSGSGFGVTKIGAGILVYSNANTYTGTTTVSVGTLRLGTGGSISDSSALSIASGATFDLNGINDTVGALSGAGSLSLGAGNFTTTVGANSTFSGAITGSGAFAKAGANTLTLSGNSSTFSGAINVNAGALRVSDANALGNTTGSTTVANNAALELTATPASAEAISLTGSGLTSGGALRNISGNNSLSGLITLAGASRINADAGSLTLDVSSGNAITGTHNLTVGGAGNVIIADNVNISGSTLTKDGAGTLTLSAANNYTGATTVTNGTLVVNGSIAGSTVSVGNATTDNGSMLMGSGSVGATTINNNGRISPGNSVGMLSVSNTLTFANGADYLWEINGTNGPAGTTWDLITVDTATTGDSAGTLALGNSGQVTVTGDAIDGFSFNGGIDYTNNYFRIIGASTVTGNVSVLSFNNVDLGSGSWTFVTNGNGLFLNYTAPGVVLLFTNSSALDQGQAGLVTNNNAGDFSQITNQGGTTAVVVSNTAPVTFTNANNNYTGATIVARGTLVTTANSPNAGPGAFGESQSTVVVGSTNGATADTATLLIGASGVDVNRGVSIAVGSTGTRTVGATNASGVATYSGNISAATNVTLSASNSGATTLFSGAVGGAGAVTIAGNGQVVFSGDNTGLTNTITVGNLSTLVASNNSALGGGSAATTVSSGGVLALAGGISTGENITIAGNGITSGGALRNVSGANTNSGTITLSANATISADSGTTLQLNNIDNSTALRQLTFSNIGTIVVAGNFSNMDTTSTFFKLGSGSLVISNTSANTGGGQLQIGAGSVTLAAGTFSTNTGTGTRGIDFGLLPSGGGGSSLATALYVNSGQTLSNSIYVAAGGGTRTLGTESTTGTGTFNNEIYLDSGVILTAASGGTARFAGNFVNNGSLTKVGSGVVILAGTNANTGDVTISNGTLAVTNGAAINNSALVTIDSGATLSVQGSETVGQFTGSGSVSVAANQVFRSRYDSASNSFAGTITGSGEFLKGGTGTLTLSGANDYSGLTTHEAGVLLIGNNSALGTGVYQVDFSNATNKTIAASGATAYTLSQSNNIYNNLTLGEATANTGKLTFSGGTFLGNEVGETRTLTVAANNNHEFSGGITGNRGIIKAGTGSLTLSGSNSFGNTFQLNEGTVLVGNNNAFGTGVVQVQFAIAGTKTIASASSTGYTITNNVNVFNDLNLGLASVGTGSLNFGGTFYLGDEIGENRFITTAAGTGHTVSGAVTGNRGIVKRGSGTLTLSGANTSTGGFFIDGGTLNLNGGSVAFSSIEVGGGVNGNPEAGDAAALRVTSGTFSTGITINGNTNASGVAGSRAIEFANASGSATLSGNVTAEKTFTASVATGAATGVLSGVISGAGGLTKTGDGTLTLSGNTANSYSGLTTVSAGTLNLNKSMPGQNAIAGDVTVNSGATLLLSASGNVANTSLVTLSGGTIRRGAGVSEAFGNLNVTAESFLDFGTGALASGGYALRFETYTASALLNVQNFLPGNKLQFASGFNAALLPTGGDLSNANFSFSNGFTTGTEDGYFTITAIPEPSTYLAAAGLLAMFLWPVRRRLIKDAKSILGLRPTGRDRIEAYRNA
jgi:fibronectin-binding autotransporter adhesin